MSTITGKDGAQIHYQDWGQGRPVVFSHGWPRDGDDAARRDQRGPPDLLQGIGAAAGAARGEPIGPATIATGG